MVDPTDVINFNRTDDQLQEFLLFCIIVAGKTASVQAQKLDDFLAPARHSFKSPFEYITSPFEYITYLKKHGILNRRLERIKIGQYTRIAQAFESVTKIEDIRACTLEDLLSVPGIGPKTARFFLVYTRRNTVHAILDTHILKFLRDSGISAPKSTPSGNQYLELEKKFIDICNKRGTSVAEFDLKIWTAYSQGNGYEEII